MTRGLSGCCISHLTVPCFFFLSILAFRRSSAAIPTALRSALENSLPKPVVKGRSLVCIAASMDDLPSLYHTTLPGVVAGVALIITIVIYRRYFSPLSGIPGPFWASFSRLWHLHVTMQGNQNEQLTEAHEKYGHFVRLANNEVSVSHPDAIRRVLLTSLKKVSLPLIAQGGISVT